jgi:multidrug efflux pump subunit AcrA (membrane-fusion protein)
MHRPIGSSRSTRAAALGIASLTLAAVVVACNGGGGAGRGGSQGGRRALPSPAPIPTVAAKSGTVKPSLTIAGIVAPFQNVGISASLSEPTLSVTVNEGDHVTKGQVLATLDTTDLQANLAAAIATTQGDDARVASARYTASLSYGQNPDQVRQAQQALVQAQQTLAQAQVDLDRDRQLVGSGYIPQQQYAQQQTTVANDQAAVRSAQAALSSAQTNQNVNGNSSQGLQAANVQSAIAAAASSRASADQIRAQIARAQVISPVDGVIVNRNLNPGEYPGSRTIFTIQQLNQVYAMLNASSADIFKITPGSYVSLRAGDDQTGRTYSGRVSAVLGQIQPGSTNFTVKALVQNPDGRLQSGVPVTATIALAPTTGTSIPTGAFLDDTHSTVMLDVNKTAKVTQVRELASDGTVSIVSGIRPGQILIANGQLGLQPNQSLVPAAAAGAGTGRRRGPGGAPAADGTAGPSGAPAASPEASASAEAAPTAAASEVPSAAASGAPDASGSPAPRRHRRRPSPGASPTGG